MLTVLIGDNLTPSHDFMKLYTRKSHNFLEKNICLFIVHKSNNYFVIRKMKHIISDYQSLFFGTFVTRREFLLPVINIAIPLRICQFHGETEPFSNSVKYSYIWHDLIITLVTYTIWEWIHNQPVRLAMTCRKRS